MMIWDWFWDWFYFYNAGSQFIEGFNCLNQDQKIIQIMNCDEIQPLLCKCVFDFYTRRKLFLV